MYSLLFELIVDLFGIFFLLYGFAVIVIYMSITALSGLELMEQAKKNKFVDYKDVITTPVAPGVSILAPAYNEGKSLVQNVRSLLSLHYSKYEVIIINDGSKDDSIDILVKHFDLKKTDYAFDPAIDTQPVKAIYRSKNPSFSKLIVVDKENGGKADALNAGINVANQELIACIDVDCILSPDSIIRMLRPFLEETNRRVIAVGGGIGIANNCDIKDGTVVKYRVPKTLLGRFQVVEYFRSFLLGRMAWSRVNGLLLISGAFGFFDKELVKKVGGYFPKTVGEDMELVVRMRRYMEEQKVPYKVAFVSDPLCWTEVPETEEVLSKQRNRWMRGTIETLQLHRKMQLNPKYGVTGMISFPFWTLFEKNAPIIEFLGLIYTFILICMGEFSAVYFISLFVLIYFFSVMLSSFSILFEELSFKKYRGKGELRKLIITVMKEPFFVHPKLMLWCIKGHWNFVKGIGGWGEMVRAGFNNVK
ncbi:glycosyltransferase family 2 protein [Echinicola strongylocentroti]|uniref:Glycosyltransferase family 2 protein n=1 Tax=Echinicola strongylocentroti TaxID=1795355 RepID=A0A2Z4IPV1_9BACT|nr:glycosyltransferase [Echinicola strongylocentroti]AWW32945.1 glycosyltransferase family 2 protein [Echinicola strongylocentroti]